MTLSFSRYAYYEIVTNQKTDTFIRCHIHAFEFFCSVPKTVKIDNLKAAVPGANFYEPVFQQQYSKFPGHTTVHQSRHVSETDRIRVKLNQALNT